MSEYANTSNDDADIALGDWTLESALEAYEQTLEACRASLAESESRELQYKQTLASYERALEASSARERKYKELLHKREREDLNWMRDLDVDQVIDSLALIKDRLQHRMLAVQVDSDDHLNVCAEELPQGPAPCG